MLCVVRVVGVVAAAVVGRLNNLVCVAAHSNPMCCGLFGMVAVGRAVGVFGVVAVVAGSAGLVGVAGKYGMLWLMSVKEWFGPGTAD